MPSNQRVQQCSLLLMPLVVPTAMIEPFSAQFRYAISHVSCEIVGDYASEVVRLLFYLIVFAFHGV